MQLTRETLIRVGVVVLGSGIGGGMRFLLSTSVQERLGASFPFGTLAVNLLGSFLLGIFFGLREHTMLLSSNLWFFLATGFCGGFTTMSTFSLETMNLVRERDAFYTTGNLLFTVAGCLVAVGIGFLIIRYAIGVPKQ